MKRAGLLSVLITIVFLLQAGAIIGARMPEENSVDFQNAAGDEIEKTDVILEAGDVLETDEGIVDFNDLVAKGYYTEKVLHMEDLMPKPYYFPGEYAGAMIYDPISEKDENDAFGNATELKDGDHIYNNVTTYHTTSGGNTYVHFNDADYYYINLTADPDNNLADRLNITITCTDGVNKSAFLGTEFGAFLLGTLLSNAGMDTMDFELTGAMQGKTSYIDVIIEATGPYYFWVDTWNDTKLNYTLDIKVTQTTVTEWNGLWFPTAGTPLDSTNRNVRMATIDQAHDTYDWYNLNGMIDEVGLDADRGDHLRLSFQVDIATEFRGAQWGYKGSGLHGLEFPTTPITNLFFVYNNYSEFNQGEPSIHLYLPDGQYIPYASQVFGSGGANDPVTLGLTSAEQIDMAWIGLASQQMWYVIAGSPPSVVFNDFGCDYGAHVAYNLTTWNIKLIPPNDPPTFDKTVPDIMYSEDEGPWMEVLDLETHFSDPESQGYLRYEIEDVGVNPSKLQLSVDENGKLNIETEENFFGQGKYRIKCYDNGSDLEPDSADDRWVRSNDFDVTILSVNDPAYIEKVDTQVGSKDNDHTPIPFNLAQGDKLIGRKIYGMDNDTEDKTSLVYTHNATTPAFSINDMGQFNYIPSNADVGETWIKVWIDDGHSPDEDDHCILRFNVSNRNDDPELLSIEWRDKGTTYDLTEDSTVVFRGVEEDMELNLTVTASDPDLDIGSDEKLNWILGSLGWEAHPHQTQPNKAYITYTPSNQDAIIGEAATTLQVIDSTNAESTSVSLTIYVENKNDPPEILFVNNEPVIDNQVVLDQTTDAYGFEDEPYILTVIANDIDPKDSLVFTASDAGFVQTADLINEFTRNFTIIPDQDHVGNHTLMITATDKKGAKASVRVIYEIVNTNDIPNKPDLNVDQITTRITENSIEFWVIDAGDPDGDEITFYWDFGDGSPQVTGTRVNHTYFRDGPFKITVTAKDGNGGEISVSDSITITLKPVVIDPDLDTDEDGIPDWWEDQFNGLDKNWPDSDLDIDGDDFTNLEEYIGADELPPSGPDDSADDSTSPIDINSHPPVTESSGKDNTMLIVIIIFAVMLFLIIIVFLLFMLMRNPKQVAAQQMYAPEAGALPHGQQQGLPAPQSQQLPAPEAQQLPPAPKAPEEDLLASFMEEAHKEVVEAEDHGQEDDVWRPPTESTEEEDTSQVDDLFSDSEEPASEQEPPEPEGEPVKEDAGVPAPPSPPKLPDLPPLPEMK